MARLDFDTWMDRVDDKLDSLVGCTTADLPDCDYWNMWDDGMTVAAAANHAIKEAGGY